MRKIVAGSGLLAAIMLFVSGWVAQFKGLPEYETLVLSGVVATLGTVFFTARLPNGWEKRAIAFIGACAVVGLVAQGIGSYFRGLPHLPTLKAAGAVAALWALLFARLDTDSEETRES